MGLMCVSCLGSLFGWQFTGANMYKGAAEFGFYPKIFAKVTSKGAPVIGMIIAGSIQTGLALMTISPSLNKQFEALVNLAVILNVMFNGFGYKTVNEPNRATRKYRHFTRFKGYPKHFYQ